MLLARGGGRTPSLCQLCGRATAAGGYPHGRDGARVRGWHRRRRVGIPPCLRAGWGAP